MIDRTRVFRFLFRLAATAPDLTRQQFMGRLVTGISNRYDALSCLLYLPGRTNPGAWADPADETYLVETEMRDICRAVAALCEDRQTFVSALDLADHWAAARQRLEDALGACDVFAFPLIERGVHRATLVMCLPIEGDAIGDPDIQALLSVGEIIRVGMESARPPVAARQPATAGV